MEEEIIQNGRIFKEDFYPHGGTGYTLVTEIASSSAPPPPPPGGPLFNCAGAPNYNAISYSYISSSCNGEIYIRINKILERFRVNINDASSLNEILSRYPDLQIYPLGSSGDLLYLQNAGPQNNYFVEIESVDEGRLGYVPELGNELTFTQVSDTKVTFCLGELRDAST